MTGMPSGKLVNLRRLADRAGRFKMLAIDQRDSLRASLAKVTAREPKEVTYAEMASAKAVITEVLSPYSTATLVDPVYGLPQAVKLVPGDVGILVANEDSYEPAGPGGKQRKARSIDGWSVSKTKRSGANAVKLLVYYNPEASAEVLAHQQHFARTVGEECLKEDIPFLLELVTYPIAESSADTPEFARKRPEHTLASAREFSKDTYHVDILKLEFPADLKYARQFCQGTFDGKDRPAVYDVEQVQAFCRELNTASQRPWVILSGGVAIKEFLVTLELAVAAGASGFLCGRAIWKDVIPKYPNVDAMRAFLVDEGAYNFARANAAAQRARPWFAHPRYGDWEDVQLIGAGERWYQDYRPSFGSM